ncbi:hypothetical protein LUZ60_001813 [Juncus effusus]|nr:hypothetical protein LUZ60_001813 [Juncus effusus]
MGGVCTRGSAVDKSPSDATDGIRDSDLVNRNHDQLLSENAAKQFQEELNSLSERLNPSSVSSSAIGINVDELPNPRISRSFSQNSSSARSKATPTKTSSTKVSEMSSIFKGKAVDMLDTLGSSMTNLTLTGSGFTNPNKGSNNKVSILAFEVANTVVKGSNLIKSLSKESVKHLREAVLVSESVRALVGEDFNELVRIAESDKREELKVFTKEVVRFGNRCKDPQWHNLERYFDQLAKESTPQIEMKSEVKSIVGQLMILVQNTAELYHELHALDRFELDYRRMSQEENNLVASQRGENIQILKQELKSQRKLVTSLKKKSLWSKSLEEVMEKLVDIVHFLHLEIHDAFGSSDHVEKGKIIKSKCVRLGPAGLALHYANIITQIDTLVSRSSSIPPNTRDALYQALPPSVKSSLKSKLVSFELKEEIGATQIKEEMEKILCWLVPIANNTTRAHHGFGWVGEWANTGLSQPSLTLLETLHHADKSKTESLILDLVIMLQHLIIQSKSPNGTCLRSPIKSPGLSPSQKTLKITTNNDASSSSVLTQEDQEMLQDVKFRKFVPGISKSQEFDSVKGKHKRLCKSSSHSPSRGYNNNYRSNNYNNNKRDLFSIRRSSMLPIIDFDVDKVKAMDLIDRVDDINSC